jgi:transposase-like protein
MERTRLADVFAKFPTSEDCMRNLETLRWRGKPICPFCGSARHTTIPKERRYRCSDCDTNYSVTVRTLFHKTHTDLRKWYLLIALIMESRTLPAIDILAAQVEVNKNTITRMVKTIRAAVTADFSLLVSITDEVTPDDR